MESRKVTAPYLAERFEVSRRTISRDIDDICKAGIPIVTTQGYDGGISIAEGYTMDKTVFTKEELKAIFTGLKSLSSISQNLQYERLIEKLSSDKNATFSFKDNILIDLSSHYKSTIAPKIETLKEAIAKQHLISFRYYSSKGEDERLVEPYIIVFKWSSWYVFGYCIDRKDFRLFKLNRLWDLNMTKQPFESREVISEQMKFDEYFTDEILLVARFDESVKYRIIEEYGVESFSCEEDKSLLFKMTFTNKAYLLSWLLSFGDKVQVIEPKALCSEIRGQAERIAMKY